LLGRGEEEEEEGVGGLGEPLFSYVIIKTTYNTQNRGHVALYLHKETTRVCFERVHLFIFCV